MDEAVNTAVADNTQIKSNAEGLEIKRTEASQPVSAPAPSPAQDLRNIQMLLISGIYPGNVAPQVVRGYQLLEEMCKKIEDEAKKPS